MEGKKSGKIILILVIIAVIAMACYIYINKTNSDKEIEELKTNVNNMQSTMNNLQEEINNTITTVLEESNNSNVVTNNMSNNNTTVSNDNVPFTEDQIKTAFTNYLELRANAGGDNLLNILTQKGDLNYDYLKDNAQNDGQVITNVKFSDYKNAMLKYVSESEFEKNWNSTQYFDQNKDGYLTKAQGGGALRVYTIKSITKDNDFTYSASTTSVVEDYDTTPENEEFTFTVKSYNGNCVIDSVDD